MSIIDYHNTTKHQPDQYARSLGYLDWDNQPNPFRFYENTVRIPLPLSKHDEQHSYTALYTQCAAPKKAVVIESLSLFLALSLGLSAWKKQSSSEWVLRMNPSSGNLHPTECYLILPRLNGITASIVHYNPLLHCLEVLGELSVHDAKKIEKLSGFGIILTSIHWREAWKYGERAFRYCHHDLGHALGALHFSANLQGWLCRMQPLIPDVSLDVLLGFDRVDWAESENESADCLCWISPQEINVDAIHEFVSKIKIPTYAITPNQLSPKHVNWEIIDRALSVTRNPGENILIKGNDASLITIEGSSRLTAETIIRNRRSALAFHRGTSKIDRDTFFYMLSRTLPQNSIPFTLYPYPTHVHLMIFVHNIDSLEQGLYCFIRHSDHFDLLKKQCDPNFLWEKIKTDLPFYLLLKGEQRNIAETISCQQNIASDGAFSLAMLAEFSATISKKPWMYSRLFWECGLIGQVLYLEAEAHNLRGTGIGCFFDDMMHQLLGLTDDYWQDIYHFTVGYPIEDTRLQTKPPYDHLQTK